MYKTIDANGQYCFVTCMTCCINKIHTFDARFMETVVGTGLVWPGFMTDSSNLPAVKHLEYEGDMNPI
jgi:hypothetical protein